MRAPVPAFLLMISRPASLVLLAFLLSQSIHADRLTLTREIAVTPADSAPAPFIQVLPEIAGNGDGYLVVWLDQRTRGYTIFAARLDSDGRMLGEQLLLGDAYFSTSPQVVWTGAYYLVVWKGPDGAAWGARVDRDGHIADRDPRRLTPADGGYRDVFLSSGDRSLLVWSDVWSEEQATFGTILDENGDVIEPAVRLGEGYLQIATGVAGHSFLLFLADSSSCLDQKCKSFTVQEVTKDGQALAPVKSEPKFAIPAFTNGNAYSLAFDGSQYLLVGTEASTRSVIAIRLSPAAQPIGEPFIITPPPPGGTSYVGDVSASWNGREFVVVWSVWRQMTEQTMHARRVSTLGQLLDPAPVTLGSGGASPRMAHGANGSALVWQKVAYSNDRFGFDAQPWDVYVQAYDGLDPNRPPELLSRSASMQQSPAIASNGTNSAVLWTEYQTALRRKVLRVVRVDSTGLPRDIAPIDIVETGSDFPWSDFTWDSAIPSAVVSDGENFQIVWIENKVLYGRRLSADGMWLDAAPKQIAVSACGLTPQGVVWNGSGYFAVWSTCWTQGQNWPEVLGVSLTRGGDPVDGAVRISDPTKHSTEPAVAFLDDQYLVGWTVNLTPVCNIGLCLPPWLTIQAARVTINSQLLDPTPLLISSNGRGPKLAAGDGVYLMAWGSRATRITKSAVALDEPEGSLLVPDSQAGSIGWDGSSFTVVMHRRNPEGSASFIGVRLNASDPIATQEKQLLEVALESYPRPYSFGGAALTVVGSRIQLAYSRNAEGHGIGMVPRVYLRTIGEFVRRRAVRR